MLQRHGRLHNEILRRWRGRLPLNFIGNREMNMQAQLTSSYMRPTVALADYDFLRATYDMLLRAPAPDQRAINAAFAALDAAHERLRAAHLQQQFGLLN
jgi:hypothetical protein